MLQIRNYFLAPHPFTGYRCIEAEVHLKDTDFFFTIEIHHSRFHALRGQRGVENLHRWLTLVGWFEHNVRAVERFNATAGSGGEGERAAGVEHQHAGVDDVSAKALIRKMRGEVGVALACELCLPVCA